MSLDPRVRRPVSRPAPDTGIITNAQIDDDFPPIVTNVNYRDIPLLVDNRAIEGPGAPARQRRRIDPGDESRAFVFTLSRDFVVNFDVLKGRFFRLITLSYWLSRTFRTAAEIENYFYANHPENYEAIRIWLVTPQTPMDNYSQRTLDQILTDYIDDLSNGNPNPWMPGIHLQAADNVLRFAASTIMYYARAGRDSVLRRGAAICFQNLEVHMCQQLIRSWYVQNVNFAEARLRGALNMGHDYLYSEYAVIYNAGLQSYATVARIFDLYQQNLFPVWNSYPGQLMLLHIPSRYMVIGFVVIAPNILDLAEAPAIQSFAGFNLTYTLDQQGITRVQRAADPWTNPPLPIGPGGLAWLIIGILDRIRIMMTSGAVLRFQVTPNNIINLQVTATFANGQAITTTFTAYDPLHPQTTDADYLQKGNSVWQQVNVLFQGHMHEFYGKVGGEDFVNYTIVSLTFDLTLPAINRRAIVGSGILPPLIDGNNVYWEDLLIPGTSKFRGYRSQFILFASVDEEKQQYLHGCVQRALCCKCKPNEGDSPKFCDCPLPTTLEAISLEDTVGLCKMNGDKYIVIVVWISKVEKGKTKKTVEFIHVGQNYFTSDDRRVLFINMPMWNKVRGHCALWIPIDQEDMARDKDYSIFLSRSRYNKVCSLISSDNTHCVCPICGETYSYDGSWGHYLKHTGKPCCPLCGLVYRTEEEKSVHQRYHCKNLPVASTIVLREDPIAYKEPTNTTTWIRVYADLESAIYPEVEGERMHQNILVGWIDTYNKEVRIARDIKEFFNTLVRLPCDNVLVYFHNGEGYDFHFVLRDLCDSRRGFVKDFSIVGDSGQKVRFFTVSYRGKTLHFRDTFAFVSDSLEKWIESSKESGCQFPYFHSSFDEHKQKILLRKNPFPYNAVCSPDDLKRPILDMTGWALSPEAEELFCFKYSREELAEFAKWLLANYVECHWKTVLDYYTDYLKCDVTQLCDVMEYFADNALQEFNINVHDYYGTPSLTWAAWLKENRLPLEPITESKHYDVINSTIRGGQTGVFTRRFVEEEEGGKMFDLDCNSLYATVMLKFAYPCHDWREEPVPEPECLLSFIQSLHENGRSAFVELDLIVPENSLYSDYIPLASKRLVRGVYNYSAMHFYGTENPDNMFFHGLTQVYGEHPHYCCHSRNLEWYITHNVVTITKVHFILSGKDEYVFKDYVSRNLEQRKKYSSDPIKKMLYKLLNNSLYGKTYEDETQRADYYLELKEKVNVQDNLKVRRVITEMGEWVLYEGVKSKYNVNKPVYLGACITEFSKLWMYQFFYDKIRVYYPDTRVYYTDTDALTIYFPTGVKCLRDIAEKLAESGEQVIDTSNFDDKDLPDALTAHNNEPGLFKSETGDHAIVKFIGLRAKTYIMVCDDGSIKMSVKGCPMKEKKRLNWDDFQRVLLNPKASYSIEFDAIRSKYHLVKSVHLTKIVLSADDRKRYITDDLIHTHPLFSQEHLEALQV